MSLLTFRSAKWLFTVLKPLGRLSIQPGPLPNLRIRVTQTLGFASHFSLRVRLSISILPKTFALVLYSLEKEVTSNFIFSSSHISYFLS